MFSWLPFTMFMQQDNPAGGSGQPSGQPTEKLVPERDLMAVKTQAEKDIADLKGQLTTLQTQLTTKHDELTRHQASVTDLQAKLAEMETLRAKVTELETSLAASKTSREQLEKTLLDTKRNALVSQYGLPADVAAKYSLEQLPLIEEVLQAAGVKRGSGFDRGGNGGTDRNALSAREKILQGLREASQ